MRSNEFLMKQTNALARLYYLMNGYRVEEGFRFDLSSHPQEVLMWRMACMAQRVLTSTEVQNDAEG